VIGSCLIQEHLKEIIVVDDFSTDQSWEILSGLQCQFPEKLKIYRNPCKGGNNARNYGFEQSSGEFIQWLDADDFLLPSKFEKQLKGFDENPGTDIVYSDFYMDFYHENGLFEKRKELKKASYDDFCREILSDNWSVPANYLFKRPLAGKLHHLKAWNPETKVAQDREYLTMAVLSGAKAFYCPGFYCVYNVWNKNSVSAMDFKTRLGHQIVLEKKFRDMIRQNNYPRQKRRQYLSLLNAHMMNACFYNPKLTITYPFSLFNIKWPIIHWKKRPFIPMIYIWQHLKYLFFPIKK
jgi:glycosyltransferase involved in cell wall biosynthesis